MTKRSNAPVFIIGCPRSGTTVLYHMLLSSGNFAVYRTESNVYSVLRPRFGDFSSRKNREVLMDAWLRSKLFKVSGLDADDIRRKIMEECRSEGDFLKITMSEIAKKQGVRRWAESTPDHSLYIQRIKRQIPDALFIHIIRDGRDVALSYAKQGWSAPLPWDRGEDVAVAGLYWKWIVQQGRAKGLQLGGDYREIFFEDLVRKPVETLTGLGEFIQHDLDWEKIQRVGVGSVSRPNSSFEGDSQSAEFEPVSRWKKKMSADRLAWLETLIGDYLEELGYERGTPEKLRAQSLPAKRMRLTYPLLCEAKLWLKNHTPLGRRTEISRMQIE